MYGEINKALNKMYPANNLAVSCQNPAGTYQEQYDSLVWNDAFCAQHPELQQNPQTKPTLQEIIDSGFLDINMTLSRKKSEKKEVIKVKRRNIVSGCIKYASADDILKTGSEKFIYCTSDNSINRITNVLNNGTSARNWQDVDCKFHLLTHAELQELLNIMIELMEKSFNNEKTLNESIDTCATEQDVDNVENTGWETIPYETVV